METSRLKRVVAYGLVVLAVGLGVFAGPSAVATHPVGGAHIAYADGEEGPNPPPDLDHNRTPTPTPTPIP